MGHLFTLNMDAIPSRMEMELCWGAVQPGPISSGPARTSLSLGDGTTEGFWQGSGVRSMRVAWRVS